VGPGLGAVAMAVLAGAHGVELDLAPGAGPYAFTRWRLEHELAAGPHELAVRATDGTGARQPDSPAWNPRGYANASVHRAAVVAR